ncbi:DUF298-domain-containing protein [Polyplosphaeria fusca]|uniref:Defective in cullin neddylation protein n=1 Tax=Polyplosphaeria fusca TaxID=682080 RepID=A0A9P4V4M9_9PLEO|nr:DUF298-domain-containing protein [Polyplosphaeria fusca]
MPPGYNSQQKAAISQFQTFTQADRNTAIRVLKNHGWNVDAAVDGHFNGGGGPTVPSGAKSNLNKIFDRYREDVAASPDAVGTEGTIKYLGDIDVDLEGLEFLAVSELVQTPAMGEMTRDGFVEGWMNVNADSIDKQKAHVKQLSKALPTSKDSFTKVYKYAFTVAKQGAQKTISIETATIYWDLLFNSPLSHVRWNTPSSPWSEWWKEFLTVKWKKAVNRDMWNETLRFAQMSLNDEAISFWNEESSWPSVIDEFVEYVNKEKRGQNGDAMEE